MDKIKKGDIVGRLSYNKDILFVVEKVIKTSNGKEFAILKGLTIRIQADSTIEDLEKIETNQIEEHQRKFNEKIENHIQKMAKQIKNNFMTRENTVVYTGKILHIDGDKKYAEKSNQYYRKLGLNAVVKNVPERKQALVINSLLQHYKPDVVVITRT